MVRLYFDENLQPGDHRALKAYKSKLAKPGRFLVTKAYDPSSYTQYAKYGIEDKVFSMYDYFQHAISFKPKDLHIRLSGVFDLSTFVIKGIDNNRSDVYFEGDKIAEVSIAPETVQLIGDVTFLNQAGLPSSRDIYDRRGFLSSTQYFDINGNLGSQVLYDVNHIPVMEIIVMNKDGHLTTTSIKLLNYQGADYLFDNDHSLFEFVRDELMEKMGKTEGKK